MLIYMHLNLLIYFGYHSSEAYVVTSDEGHYRKLLQSSRRTSVLIRLSREENQSSRMAINWVKVEKPFHADRVL